MNRRDDRRRNHRVWFACLLVLAALLFGACGDDGGSRSEPSMDAPAATDAPTRSGTAEAREGSAAEEAADDSGWSPLFADERVYHAYRYQPLNWTEDQASLPQGWVDAARDIVAANDEIEGEITFRQGHLYDLDGDGRDEALISFHGFVDSILVDTHTVYVNADGQATLLDQGSEARGPEAGVLHYGGFRHLLLRTGGSSASGSVHLVFRMADGAFERLLAVSWFVEPDDFGVFLESGGPQGIGPVYYFWDAAQDRYSAVAAAQLPIDAFVEHFDPDRLYHREGAQITLGDLGLPDDGLTEVLIDRVDTYGYRFFNITLAAPHPDDARCTTWELLPDGRWRLIYGPERMFGMGSLAFGDAETFRETADVDMAYAERSAVPPSDPLPVRQRQDFHSGGTAP